MVDAILPSHRFRLFETPNTHEGGPHADVYLPTVPAPASGYPLALFWHGGAWIVGGARHLQKRPYWIKWLLDEGIVVLSLDYRLAPHVDLEAITDDVRRGHEFAVGGGLAEALKGAGSEVKLDVARVGIFGPSAGGHIVTWLGATANPPVRGVLAYFAPVDWEFLNPSDAGEPPADTPVRAAIDAVLAFPAATETTHDLPGHEPKEDHELARQALMIEGYRSRTVGFIAKRAPSNDPYLLATSAYPPTYLVHGDADPVVPRACSDRFHARLQALGVDSTLAIVPGAGHGWAIEEGGEGELGERFEMDKKAFEWLVRRIKASA